MFGGSGLKGKMMRRMTGMPDMSGLAGMGEGNGGEEMASFPSLGGAPGGTSRKKLKKKRKKKRR
jgi:hypothetical protein